MIVIRLTFELVISYLQVDSSGLGIYLRRWFFDLLYLIISLFLTFLCRITLNKIIE